MFLLTGIAWQIVSLIVLRFTVTSVATIGVPMGVFLAARTNEFLIVSIRRHWQWAQVLLGIVFSRRSDLGIRAYVRQSRVINGVWWLGVAGALQILVGFWASQQMVSARAALLISWVGLLALFRGIAEIVLAFELKSAQHADACWTPW